MDLKMDLKMDRILLLVKKKGFVEENLQLRNEVVESGKLDNY